MLKRSWRTKRLKRSWKKRDSGKVTNSFVLDIHVFLRREEKERIGGASGEEEESFRRPEETRNTDRFL